MATTIPFFSSSLGYGFIIGVGALFAIVMSLISYLLSRFMAAKNASEEFMTANHSVKTGLTASAVVSSWTIAATLLSSTTEGYSYGVSGPFWYGAGATVQIFLFAVAAIELKRKAPNCHTFLEVVKIRYGPPGHILFMTYSLFVQLFQAVNLLVGGSTLFAKLTGMNRDAACLLTPIGVLVYTFFGGIKATFLTDWVHTVIIYVIMLIGIFVAYSTSSVIGSPGRMWELLHEASILHPVVGNQDGSYLTMDSQGGGYIGLIFIGAGFAAAVDSQLFQKAIAADPASTLPAYMLGGLCWFTIPFVLASTFGLSAAALEHLPVFPTYPNRMTAEEVATGMAMPYAAYALLGKGGAAGVLIMVFMAVTCAMSSETVATAGLVTYDIYKGYINPKADSRRLVMVSHITVVAYGVIVACVAIAFNHAGFSVSYIVTAIGIVVDSAIVPMACTIMWKKQSLAAMMIAPVFCSMAGVLAWLLTAWTHYGAVTITTTSQALPLVAGNMMALCGPLVVTPLVTYIRPANFDFERLKKLEKDFVPGVIESIDLGDVAAAVSATHFAPVHCDDEKTKKDCAAIDARLLKARNKAIICAAVLCLSFLILWPIPMYGTGYVFSKGFFTGWIVVVFLWAFFAALTITLLPLWEGRHTITQFCAYLSGSRSSKIVVLSNEQLTPRITAEDAVRESKQK